MTDYLWRCTVCGRFGTVGRCCGEETRERASIEQLLAENDRLRAEVERLTECLHRANAQAEHFEREWYLRGEEVDDLRAKIEAMERQGPHSEWFSWLPEGTTHIDKVDCYLIPHYGFKAFFKPFKYIDGVLHSYRTDSDNENGRWIRAEPLYKVGRVPEVYPLYLAPGAKGE